MLTKSRVIRGPVYLGSGAQVIDNAIRLITPTLHLAHLGLYQFNTITAVNNHRFHCTRKVKL